MESTNTSISDPAYWQEQFTRFRLSHPNHQIEFDGCCWNYLEGGQGSQWVVLLHSAAAGAESLYCQINLLESKYKILAPTIPGEVMTMQGACEGLAAILDHKHIQTTHIVGFSIGGMLAQCFLRSYPERVLSVVLSHTVLPMSSHAEGLAQAQKEYSSVAEAKLLEGALQMLQDRHAHQPKPLDPADWIANRVVLEELYQTGAVQKAELLGWLALEEDYHRYCGHGLLEKEKRIWKQPMLIIESDADEVYTLKEREALQEAYPGAQVHTFEGWGHLGIVATGPVIKAFLGT